MLVILDGIWMYFGRSAGASSCRVRGNGCHVGPWDWAVCCSLVHSCRWCWPLMQKSIVDELKVYLFVQAMVLRRTGQFSLLIWFPLSSCHLWTQVQPPVSTFCCEVITLSLGGQKAVIQSLEFMDPGTECELGKITCFTSYLLVFFFVLIWRNLLSCHVPGW